MELNDILKAAMQLKASDVHIKAGLPPIFRISGKLTPFKKAPRLTPEMVNKMAFGIMNNAQKEKFKQSNEADLAYGVPGLGRFRVNVFQQRGTVGMVLRSIPFGIKTIDQLLLPKVIEKVSSNERGLVLVTGTTGSGKSTTLAAMIDFINSHRTAHIMTIEDPIEFLHRDKKSIVNQREVGFDTVGFASALRAALRQDPDVILVGEMRDFETIEIALTAAETGHLVFSTLHTLDAQETITRIVTSFPPYQQNQVRLQLAGIIKGIVSQRLVPTVDGQGRVAAVEVLVSTARTRDCISDKEKVKELGDAMAKGGQTYGMQTFDQSLMQHLRAGRITYEEALRQSTNPDDFALRYSGISATSDSTFDEAGSSIPQAQPPAQQQPAAGTTNPGSTAPGVEFDSGDFESGGDLELDI
ncbi:MAG: type IV pilus twitching motility protein PilT [Chrysiogenetes bacterium]|nr:type IV pilus twitching motility protein PilT [Chrysiogenetes bacterium]